MRIIEKLAKKTPEFKSNEVKIVSDIKNSISKYKNLFAFLFFCYTGNNSDWSQSLS